ncbi:MAG: aminotransferase class IV [Cyanobacteria bacterium HKST-UBA03]|nr:aminotransferase class IV [Cyanobacteria bacterium HKST-UBA03]
MTMTPASTLPETTRPPAEWYTLNDALCFEAERLPHPLPAGLLRGVGVFTAIRWLPGLGPFRLTQHYNRLRDNAAFYGWPCPWPDATAFGKSLADLMARPPFNTRPTLLRVTLLPLYTSLDDPKLAANSPVATWLTHRPLPVDMDEASRLFVNTGRARSLQTVSFERPHPGVKHINYYMESVSVQAAVDAGFDDVLRRSAQGLIQEASRANIFFLRSQDGVVLTPSVASGCLPGVMRQALIEAAPTLGLQVLEDRIEAGQLAEMTGAWMSNSGGGLIPVDRIDDHAVPTEAVYSLLGRLSEALVARYTQ